MVARRKVTTFAQVSADYPLWAAGADVEASLSQFVDAYRAARAEAQAKRTAQPAPVTVTATAPAPGGGDGGAPQAPEATTETYPVEGPKPKNAAEEAAKPMPDTVTLKPVVWLMRHQPTPAQTAWLAERGLRAVQPEAALAGAMKFASGADAWAQALAANDGATPAAVVGVIPVAMLPDYLRAAGPCPLWRMEMESAPLRPIDEGGKAQPVEYVWTGRVTRVVRVEIVTEPVA